MAEVMNTTEGFMRLAAVIRWVSYLIGAAVAIYAFAVGTPDAYALLVVAAALGGAGWTVAWVVEGFAKPKP